MDLREPGPIASRFIVSSPVMALARLVVIEHRLGSQSSPGEPEAALWFMKPCATSRSTSQWCSSERTIDRGGERAHNKSFGSVGHPEGHGGPAALLR